MDEADLAGGTIHQAASNDNDTGVVQLRPVTQ